MFFQLPVRIFVAESQHLKSLGISGMLRHSAEIEVVAELHHCDTTLPLISLLKPDLVLLDSDCDGLKTICDLRQAVTGIEVLALSATLEAERFNNLLKAGVKGYGLKDTDARRLSAAVLTTGRGDLWIDGRLCRHIGLLAGVNGNGCPDDTGVSRYSPTPAGASEPLLSTRELQIIRMIVQGATNREIAQSLYLSVSTVKTVVRRILDKFQVEDRTQAAVFATRNGFV